MEGIDLTRFDGALLGRIWPSEHVVAGLRVCKYLRDQLMLYADKVALRWRRRWDTTGGRRIDIGADLALFKHDRVLVQLHMRRVNRKEIDWVAMTGYETFLEAVVEGIQAARSSGWKGRIELLDISSNRITANDAPQLSRLLQECPSLTSLDVQQNTLSAAGAGCLADAPCTGLENLNLRWNFIASSGAVQLGSLLHRCPNLRTLDLTGNSISDDGAGSLAEALGSCPDLIGLTLLLNAVGTEGMGSLAQSAAAFTNLVSLNVGGNGLINAELLATVIGKCSHLKHLSACMNKLGDPGALAIAPSLRLCTGLAQLDLHDNAIQAAGAEAVAGALQSCLESLDLAHNRFGSDGASHIATALLGCSRLVHLDLRSNRWGDDAATQLGQTLPACGALAKLRLGANPLNDEGATALAAGLERCSALVELDLCATRCGGGLKEVVTRCQALRGLMLSECHLGDVLFAPIAHHLASSNQLTALSLIENKLSVAGAGALGELLSTACELRMFHMHDNNIGDQGAEMLSQGLAQCSQLKVLGLRQIGISDLGLVALIDGALSSGCSSLTHLNVAKNSIGRPGLQQLGAYARRCESLEVLDVHANLLSPHEAQKCLPAGLGIEIHLT